MERLEGPWPGGARRHQEPGGARRHQEPAGGARSQEEPGASRSQEENLAKEKKKEEEEEEDLAKVPGQGNQEAPGGHWSRSREDP